MDPREHQVIADFQRKRSRYRHSSALSGLLLFLFAASGELFYEHSNERAASAAALAMFLLSALWISRWVAGKRTLTCPSCGEDFSRIDGFIAFWWSPNPAVCSNCGARLK
jgi:hypothetical protein